MTHTVEPIGTFRDGRPIHRCSTCGRKFVGQRVVGECEPRTKPPHKRAPPLPCVHRREPAGVQVPCGICPTTGRPKMATVYVCILEGGRPCTLRQVGVGDKQRVHGALPIACSTCEERSIPLPSAGE